jgi:hypothetical protein
MCMVCGKMKWTVKAMYSMYKKLKRTSIVGLHVYEQAWTRSPTSPVWECSGQIWFDGCWPLSVMRDAGSQTSCSRFFSSEYSNIERGFFWSAGRIFWQKSEFSDACVQYFFIIFHSNSIARANAIAPPVGGFSGKNGVGLRCKVHTSAAFSLTVHKKNH